MTKFTKIIYSVMFLICITSLIFKLIDRDFYMSKLRDIDSFLDIYRGIKKY